MKKPKQVNGPFKQKNVLYLTLHNELGYQDYKNTKKFRNLAKRNEKIGEKNKRMISGFDSNKIII